MRACCGFPCQECNRLMLALHPHEVICPPIRSKTPKTTGRRARRPTAKASWPRPAGASALPVDDRPVAKLTRRANDLDGAKAASLTRHLARPRRASPTAECRTRMFVGILPRTVAPLHADERLFICSLWASSTCQPSTGRRTRIASLSSTIPATWWPTFAVCSGSTAGS